MAAWLASLTRLASCFLAFGFLALAFGKLCARGLVAHEQAQDARAASQQHQCRQAHHHHVQRAQAAGGGQALLQRLQSLAQRLAVTKDRALRVACRDQALQVAKNCARLCLGGFVLLQQRGHALPGLWLARARQTQFGIAGTDSLGQIAKGLQVLAQQVHGLGVDAFNGDELAGTLADALRQHHQLAHRRQFGGRGALLQLERRHGLGDVQQVAGLLVDQAQRLTHIGQRLLLRQHDGGVLLGTPDQRQHRIHCFLDSGRSGWQVLVTPHHRTHVAAQHLGTFLDFREGLRRADHRLRRRFGQPLRFHQRLADRADLFAAALGRTQRQHGGHDQAQQSSADQPEQHALLLRRAEVADQRQRRAARRRVGHWVLHSGFAEVARHFRRRHLGDDGRVVRARVGCRHLGGSWGHRVGCGLIGVGRDDVVELRLVSRVIGTRIARPARDLVHEAHVTLFG